MAYRLLFRSLFPFLHSSIVIGTWCPVSSFVSIFSVGKLACPSPSACWIAYWSNRHKGSFCKALKTTEASFLVFTESLDYLSLVFSTRMTRVTGGGGGVSFGLDFHFVTRWMRILKHERSNAFVCCVFTPF